MALAILLADLPSLLASASALALALLLLWFRFGAGDGPRAHDGGEALKQGPTVADAGSSEGESAAACWSRKDGRFKHCGLRDDPYDLVGTPPRYSLANLPLPLPDLPDAELAAVRQLAALVQDLAVRRMRTDEATLLRFVRARKGNVKAAEAYFRQACAYRDTLDLPGMEETWNLEAYEKCFAPWWARGGIIGHGLKGQIVGFERFGRCALPDLLEALPFEVLRRLDAVHMARTLAAFEEDALRRGRWFGDATLVLDLEGLTWKYCTLKVVRAYARLVECRDMLMPNTLAQVLVIRAPRQFAAGWRMLQHLLDPVVREKVQIVASGPATIALLRRYIGDDVIPAYVGGSHRALGDPECRSLLGSASPGPPPPEAVARLLALASGEGGGGGSADGAKAAGGPASPAARARPRDCFCDLGCCAWLWSARSARVV